MHRTFLTIALFIGLVAGARAQNRVFQNAEKTKSFTAELTGYDPETKVVSVKLKNGKTQRFAIDVLCEEDREYILENAELLAVANDLTVELKSFQDSSTKKTADRIEDRVYPSGYVITLGNRSRKSFEDITLNYTLYYAVQDYISPDRKSEMKTGTLSCKIVPPLTNIQLRTETVDIVSGKKDPLMRETVRKLPDGTSYVDVELVEPGGRRKDLLVGCRVQVIVKGRIVKTAGDGDIPNAGPGVGGFDGGPFPVAPPVVSDEDEEKDGEFKKKDK